MKKITISKSQEKIINEALVSRVQLPSHIFSDIERGDVPFDSTYFYSGKLLLDLAVKRFQEVKDAFSDDISEYSDKQILSELSRLIVKCRKKEEGIREQLQKICINSLLDLFDVPEDGINIDAEIVPEISSRTQFHITPDTDENFEYEDVESIKNGDSEVKKRCIIDAIIVGAAMRLSETSLKGSFEKIFEIDEELPHLYSKIMKINDYLLFSHPFEIEDNSHKQGGYVEVTLGNDVTPTKIEARAVMAPMLLIELIRGCMELWASCGLPDDIDSARATLNKADALINDPWYSRLGPAIWDKIENSIQEFDTKTLPTFIMKLASFPTEQFEKEMSEVLAGTLAGKNFIEKTFEEAKYDDEYSSFEYDIQQKQSERGVIEDGYFTEEELDNSI